MKSWRRKRTLNGTAVPPLPVIAGRRDLGPILRLKSALTTTMPMEAALCAYDRIMGTNSQGSRWKRLRSLDEAALAEASDRIEIFERGITVHAAAPRILGPGSAEDVSGVSRSVFLAAFDSARVRHRSSFVELEDSMLLDYQADEFSPADVYLAWDTAVFAHEDDQVMVLGTEGQPVIEVPEALKLLGSTSYSFGHWLVEYMTQWGTVSDRNELEGIPILIDQGMAPTHREALEYFLPRPSEIIEVPVDTSVVARRIWVASNWVYAPLFPTSEEAIHARHLIARPEQANVLRKLGARVDRDMEAWRGPTRVYFGRRAGLHRRMINSEQIEGVVRRAGFQVIYPEDLSFCDQVRMVRGATHIMGPEGSAMLLSHFARPATKTCWLDHPFIERVTPITAVLGELGIETVFVTGPCVNRSEPYLRFSDYTIDEQDVVEVIREWGLVT